MNKLYNKLLRAIRKENKLNEESKEFLSDYVKKVRDGRRNNDFFEFDFLNTIILDLINSEEDISVIDTFNKTVELIKVLLPAGVNTSEYEMIKNFILSGSHKIDLRLYPLINDRLEYIQIVKIINSEAKDYFNEIVNYAIDVSPYCINSSILKGEILSFINGLKHEIDDLNAYYKNRLEEAKKRCGVYPLDEKRLALISAEVEKAQSLIRKLEQMQKRVDAYTDQVKALTVQGKKEIDEATTAKINKISDNIRATEEEILSKLDEHLLTLEQDLKKSSDAIFNQILEESRTKIREIKLSAKSISTRTTDELLRIKQTTEDSIDELKRFVETEPLLQECLKNSALQTQIKEALLTYEGKDKAPLIESTPTSEGIKIEGYDKVILPMTQNVIIPSLNPPRTILQAFDENIPFKERLNNILERKKERESKGEIFHKLTDEIIVCVMEGDWVYLWGPSGCGKSYIIKQVASLIGIDYVENGKITEKHSIMAYTDPHGRFRATQTFISLLYGKLLSLDEFDNGNPDTQVVLNEIYSGLLDTLANPNEKKYITFAEDMTVPIHPNFRMISAGNTTGEGANPVYSSRKKIDESVQDRMTPKKFEYDNLVEQKIFGKYTNWYNFFKNFRTCCDRYAKVEDLSSPPGMITTRDAAAIVKYIEHNSKSIEQILNEKFIQTKDESYLKSIAYTMKELYNIKGDADVEINKRFKIGNIDEILLAKKLVYQCNNTKNNHY